MEKGNLTRQNSTFSSIKNNIAKSFNASLDGDLAPIEKAHVKQHTRTSKSGKMTNVKEHDDKRSKKETALQSYKRDRNIAVIGLRMLMERGHQGDREKYEMTKQNYKDDIKYYDEQIKKLSNKKDVHSVFDEKMKKINSLYDRMEGIYSTYLDSSKDEKDPNRRAKAKERAKTIKAKMTALANKQKMLRKNYLKHSKQTESEKLIQVGYGTKKLLKPHVEMLNAKGIKAKIMKDGHTYNFKGNRSLVVPNAHTKEAKKFISKWHKENPHTPTPYTSNFNDYSRK